MLSFEKILIAQERLLRSKAAVVTPLLPVNFPGAASLYIKAECLQFTGSFKFRGAFNELSRLHDSNRSTKIVACSSGNHGQGVAAAAKLLGLDATIVMPSDAPAVKIERTARYGASIIHYNRDTEDRFAIARSICNNTGAVFVHPFENEGVMAGQGTIGLEIVDQFKTIGRSVDQIVLCCGGGGLSGGIISAIKPQLTHCKFILVEPEGFDDYGRSLKSGIRETNKRQSGSICDALQTNSPGELSFSICKSVQGLYGKNDIISVTVNEEEVRQALWFAFSHLRLVLEPGGAVALAAALKGKIPQLDTLTTVLIASGGNVDAALFESVINNYR